MKIQPFETHTQKYEDWFKKNKYAYLSELNAVKELLPEGKGVEIGVGSGRFAAPLHIRFGLEPSEKMREIAKKRGINTIEGVAEKLPYKNEEFDYALMVTTLCFLDDVDKSFKEVYRILKPGGCFINGFVDRESKIGKLYEKNKQQSAFYSVAKFYSVDEVVEHLTRAGFKDFNYRQTIFFTLDKINSINDVKKGYGEGSFVVIRARKPRTGKK